MSGAFNNDVGAFYLLIAASQERCNKLTEWTYHTEARACYIASDIYQRKAMLTAGRLNWKVHGNIWRSVVAPQYAVLLATSAKPCS